MNMAMLIHLTRIVQHTLMNVTNKLDIPGLMVTEGHESFLQAVTLTDP